MIQTETYTVNGKKFVRTYSDNGCMIERDGVLYAEAVDPAETGRTYTETDEPVETMSEMEEKAMAYDIIMGEAE